MLCFLFLLFCSNFLQHIFSLILMFLVILKLRVPFGRANTSDGNLLFFICAFRKINAVTFGTALPSKYPKLYYI